jgi:hypothetical protein
VTRDPLLHDDGEWPTEWTPFTVIRRPAGSVLELVVRGALDAWTAGALYRDLVDAYEPSYDAIRLDLDGVSGADWAGMRALARCRDFAARRGVPISISSSVGAAVAGPESLAAS